MKYLQVISVSGFIVTHAAAMHCEKDPILHSVVVQRDIYTLQKCITQKYNLEEQDRYKRTCLHVAVDHRVHEIAQMLIDAGANVNARDSDGRTPLISAIIYDDSKMCKILRDAHADEAIADKYGRKAEDYDQLYKHEITEKLIDKGYEIKVQQRDNCSCALQ